MPDSPTGDRRMDRLLPLATKLVRAAHRNDHLGVEAVLVDAEDFADDPVTAARMLVVLLAAMCPDDATASELLAWRRNPVEYHRLRGLGVPSAEARTLAARLADSLRGSAA